MCLAIPGKILTINEDDAVFRIGRVSFGGIVKEINLVYVPKAEVDDYVVVHVGFAISILDQNEAKRLYQDLDQIRNLGGS